MAEPFYKRLAKYYLKVAEVLRGEAEAATIFPNSTDKGGLREGVYAEFLRAHLPSKCNVFFGGYLFHSDGSESKQLDVIVTTDTAPRFDFDYGGVKKSFAPSEGSLAVASIKSKLDKKQLFDALDNIASIPSMESLADRAPPGLHIRDYEDWPYKIIFASDSISVDSILEHLSVYFNEHPEIPLYRRPNLIHVPGKMAILRATDANNFMAPDGDVLAGYFTGTFCLMERGLDITAITSVIQAVQSNAQSSTFISYPFAKIMREVQFAGFELTR